MEEQTMLKGIKENNITSYEKLLEQYLVYVAKVVVKVAGNRLSKEDIEEVCMDVFVKFWQDREKISIQEGKLKPYIGRMARNKTINMLRSRGTYELIPLEEDEIEYETPEQHLLNKEDTQLINEVIDTLPEPDREIFIRRYFYMEKVIDIGNRLGINTQTVGSKLFRGKQKLEKALRKRGVSYE